MRSSLRILLLWACTACMVSGRAGAVEVAPELACGAAGGAAERSSALPANLLASIGQVESGRMNPLTGRITAWPWTVNVDGAGHYFTDEQDAAAFARMAASSGAGDVDVGCFQISLQQHPGAFASMDAAFDPAANAAFAARFLNALKLHAGSWEAAIADYHSALPALGLPYQRRVLAAWRHLGQAPADVALALFTLADPTVILEGPAARRVRVITMGDKLGDGDAASGARRWLPRVITP